MSRAGASAAPPEKDELKLGFIKLTDCAPLVIAKELGFFEQEDLYVTLEAQANWKILLDRVIAGELDGAHMLAGQPIGATIGIGTKAHLVTALSLDLNGNAITVSNDVWKKMQAADPRLAAAEAAAPDLGAGAGAGGGGVEGEGQAAPDGHGLPALHPQLRAALLARRGRHPSRPLHERRHDRHAATPTC